MAGPSPKRLCVLRDVSGVRIKSRLEMLAPRSSGLPVILPRTGIVCRSVRSAFGADVLDGHEDDSARSREGGALLRHPWLGTGNSD